GVRRGLAQVRRQGVQWEEARLQRFIGIQPQLGARIVRGVDHRYSMDLVAVGVDAEHMRAGKDAQKPQLAKIEADFLPDLPPDRLLGGLAWLHEAANQAPLAIIGALDEQ